MLRPPPRSQRPSTPFPYPTPFRSRAYNAALNELPAVPYRTLRWDTPNDSLGRFDLIIGSDILYERDHAERLSALLPRHAQRVCEVLITDPGRGNSAPF